MPDVAEGTRPVESSSRAQVVARIAGGSGDGGALSGGGFAVRSALAGNGVATFPDGPAEIRAPRGTTFGVPAFQVRSAGRDVERARSSQRSLAMRTGDERARPRPTAPRPAATAP